MSSRSEYNLTMKFFFRGKNARGNMAAVKTYVGVHLNGIATEH